MSMLFRLVRGLATTLALCASASGLELQSTTVPGRVPGVGGFGKPLANGEMAINRSEGKLFYLDEAGAIVGGLLPDLDASNYLKFRNGMTLGRNEGGKLVPTPERVDVMSGGARVGVLSGTPGNAYLASVDPLTNALMQSVGVTPDGINLSGFLTAYNGGTVVRPQTFGGAANATGLTLSINALRSCVPDFAATPSILSTYAGRDHVALCSYMRAPPVLTIPDAGSTYTATSLGNAAIVDALGLRKGMVVDTGHVPKWSGVITAINTTTHAVTVSSWYRVDGSGTTGTPANGTGGLVNRATKTWLSNTVHDIGVAFDNDAISHEADQIITRSGLGEIYGWDAVAYGGYQPNNLYAHTARHGGEVARYHAGLYALDTIRAAIIAKQTSSSNYGQGLIRSEVGPDLMYQMDASGKRSADRVWVATTAVSMAVDPINTSLVICTNGPGSIDLTLPAPTGYNTGRVIEAVALGAGACNVKRPDGSVIHTLPSGFGARSAASGNAWQPIASAPVASSVSATYVPLLGEGIVAPTRSVVDALNSTAYLDARALGFVSCLSDCNAGIRAQNDAAAQVLNSKLTAIGAEIFFGRGIWPFSVGISATDKHIGIRGEGAGRTYFDYTGTGILFDVRQTSLYYRISIQDITVWASSVTVDRAIRIVRPQGSSSTQSGPLIRNVEIIPSNSALYQWAAGIDCTGCWNLNVSDSLYVGKDNAFSGDFLILRDRSTPSTVVNNKVFSGNRAIWMPPGSYSEGLIAAHNQFVAVNYGIYMDNGNNAPGAQIIANHINARKGAIVSIGRPQVIASKNLLYKYGDATTGYDWIGIYLGPASSDASLDDNQFYGYKGAVPGSSTAVSGTQSTAGSVTGGMFADLDYGINGNANWAVAYDRIKTRNVTTAVTGLGSPSYAGTLWPF